MQRPFVSPYLRLHEDRRKRACGQSQVVVGARDRRAQESLLLAAPLRSPPARSSTCGRTFAASRCWPAAFGCRPSANSSSRRPPPRRAGRERRPGAPLPPAARTSPRTPAAAGPCTPAARGSRPARAARPRLGPPRGSVAARPRPARAAQPRNASLMPSATTSTSGFSAQHTRQPSQALRRGVAAAARVQDADRPAGRCASARRDERRVGLLPRAAASPP